MGKFRPRAGNNITRAKARYTPVLFAKKKGGLRFCVDYRGLNNITRNNQYTLPLIKETLSGIFKVKYFIKLNITVVFYKIRIAKG